MECAAEFPAAVQPISDDWNSTEGITPTKNPSIRAWHGIGNAVRRCALMRAELAALEKATPRFRGRPPEPASSTSRRNLRDKRSGLRQRFVQL